MSQTRVRGSWGVTTGSLFEAAEATAVEHNISEAYLQDVALPIAGSPGQEQRFYEFYGPGMPGFYWPLPTGNSEHLSTYVGETILGRMARTIPDSLAVIVRDDPDFMFVGDTATPRQVLQYLFDRWSSEFTWFRAAPAPDLRLLVPEAIGDERDYYIGRPDAGLLEIEALFLDQSEQRRSMRQILDEFLAVFPGTVITTNMWGDLQVIPLVGPDAPDPADAVVVRHRDLYQLDVGKADPSTVVNRCTVASRGYEFVEGSPLTPPLYWLVANDGYMSEDLLESEGVHPKDDPREEVEGWDVREFDTPAPSDPIEVQVTLTAFGSGSRTSNFFGVESTTTQTITLAPGESKEVSVGINSRAQNWRARVRVRRASNGNGISIGGYSGFKTYVWAGFPVRNYTYFSYAVMLDVTGTSWRRSTDEVTATFGKTGDYLEHPEGGNAITKSITEFGEREATIRSDLYQLTPEQAQDIAQAYVTQRINPRSVHRAEQSHWGEYGASYAVDARDVGRWVELPNGQKGIIQARDYQDSFTPDGGTVGSSFEVVTVGDYVIPLPEEEPE